MPAGHPEYRETLSTRHRGPTGFDRLCRTATPRPPPRRSMVASHRNLGYPCQKSAKSAKQIRQLRSDLSQQLQIGADAAALGDGEQVLDHDGMSMIELEQHTTAERRSNAASAAMRPASARI